MSLSELQEHFIVHSIEKRELSTELLYKDLKNILAKVNSHEYEYIHKQDGLVTNETLRIIYHIEQGLQPTFEEYMIIAIFVLSLKETSK